MAGKGQPWSPRFLQEKMKMKVARAGPTGSRGALGESLGGLSWVGRALRAAWGSRTATRALAQRDGSTLVPQLWAQTQCGQVAGHHPVRRLYLPCRQLALSMAAQAARSSQGQRVAMCSAEPVARRVSRGHHPASATSNCDLEKDSAHHIDAQNLSQNTLLQSARTALFLKQKFGNILHMQAGSNCKYIQFLIFLLLHM